MTLTETAAQHIEAQGADPGIWKRYSVAPGRIMVVRDRASDSYAAVTDVGGVVRQIYTTQERQNLNQAFEPWATVLMVGEARKTDYGSVIDPPDVREGQRVLISATGGRDIEINTDDAKMTLTVIPFEAIILIDRGEP